METPLAQPMAPHKRHLPAATAETIYLNTINDANACTVKKLLSFNTHLKASSIFFYLEQEHTTLQHL